MAIKRRLRSEYWLVSKDDDAFDVEGDATLARALKAYSRSYDLRHLESWLAAHPDAKPTKFRCKPLDAKWHRIIGTLTSGDWWGIFAEHVTVIESLLDEHGNEIAVRLEEAGGGKRIPERYRDDGSLPAKDYMEIAQAIMHRGTTSDNTPFGSPDTSREWSRMRGYMSLARREDAALLIGSASAKTSQRSAHSASEADLSQTSVESTEGGDP